MDRAGAYVTGVPRTRDPHNLALRGSGVGLQCRNPWHQGAMRYGSVSGPTRSAHSVYNDSGRLRDRTRAGLASAKARGRLGGRPTVMSAERIEVARRMRAEKATWATIAQTLHVGVSSVRRALTDDVDKHELTETG